MFRTLTMFKTLFMLRTLSMVRTMSMFRTLSVFRLFEQLVLVSRAVFNYEDFLIYRNIEPFSARCPKISYIVLSFKHLNSYSNEENSINMHKQKK